MTYRNVRKRESYISECKTYLILFPDVLKKKTTLLVTYFQTSFLIKPLLPVNFHSNILVYKINTDIFNEILGPFVPVRGEIRCFSQSVN